MEQNLYDVIIIGTGPAGMTAAVYASRAELKVMMLESGVTGGKITLTAEIENWPGKKHVEGGKLASEMLEHAKAFGAELSEDEAVDIEDKGAVKEVQCASGKVYRAKTVILASGTKDRKLGIPGEAEFYGMGVSYCSVCDGAFFRNLHVLVVGGGNTAFQEAIYLTRFASKVTIVTRRRVARAEKALQTRAKENSKIEWIKPWKPQKIEGENGILKGVLLKQSESGEEKFIECDGVFPFVGIEANTDYLKKFPEILSDRGFVLTDEEMKTKIPGIFAAGDVREKGLRQIVTAVGDAAIAAQQAAEYIENMNA